MNCQTTYVINHKLSNSNLNNGLGTRIVTSITHLNNKDIINRKKNNYVWVLIFISMAILAFLTFS